ncbi:MarR family winged helix-turn-helix transcriptional regulator [Sphingopyxis panaciterrulae]|jgi:DNA-binding MarR family transcriptional regulator|uniref:DNA-binding MarR family transcriptional regulator n=1 Tax=Sphingopyxis panaciterrulae TaxID=462372 RepID=A0A7W9B4M4_9SPHN|nr:MarR family winged helix-turn-helix transcriptional regulator [Sphingopyxis panaciterrulae]MBB5706178.1 DNA-binding MarR family transcriptional regulator [Sphingopyxis panaciterrulae]
MVAKTLNLDQFLPYRLSIASNALSERIAADYQNRFGLKIPEWRLMAVLGEGAPKTQRELVAKTRMDKVTVNRAAKALADRQLIRRQAHEADGRSHHLELTETGWSLYDAIVPAALSTEERLESHISGKERQALMAILAKLIHAAKDYD